jgi:hypothetical protein
VVELKQNYDEIFHRLETELEGKKELSNELQQYLSKLAEIAGVKDAQTLGQQLTIIFEGGALIERLSPGTGAAKRARNAAITLIKVSV